MGFETVAVDEVLDIARGSCVRFAGMLNQFERGSKFTVQAVRRVTFDGKAATFLGAIWAECGNDHTPAWLDGLHDLFDVGAAICGISEEMKNRPVMPDVVGLRGQIDLADVTDDPFDRVAFDPKSLSGHTQGFRGQVQDGEFPIPRGQQIIDQGRGAAADVDDGRRFVTTDGLNQGEGMLGMRLKPTHRIGGFGLVDIFPVCSVVHIVFKG